MHQAAQRAEPLVLRQEAESEAEIQKRQEQKSFMNTTYIKVLSATFFQNSVIFWTPNF